MSERSFKGLERQRVFGSDKLFGVIWEKNVFIWVLGRMYQSLHYMCTCSKFVTVPSK